MDKKLRNLCEKQIETVQGEALEQTVLCNIDSSRFWQFFNNLFLQILGADHFQLFMINEFYNPEVLVLKVRISGLKVGLVFYCARTTVRHSISGNSMITTTG